MDRTLNRAGICYKLLICLYAVGLPALAQEAPITNIAQPNAAASGSVINQGVQVMNGQYMTQSYGGGVACQGTSLNFTPFTSMVQNQPWDPEAYGSHSLTPGFAMSLNVPLDGSLVEICKARAKMETERQKAETAKAKLDFELVRLLKCGEAKKKGIDFHPNSPYAKICSDVILTQTSTSQPTVSPSSSPVQNRRTAEPLP